jgi:hypothetical protein
MLTLPARVVGENARAWCTSCGAMHVHSLDEPRPIAQCSDKGSLGSWLGYQLLYVDDAADDDDLAPLGLDLLLLARGWRECRDRQSWLHPVHGRRSTPNAAVLQMRIDALHAAQLRRQEPIPC